VPFHVEHYLSQMADFLKSGFRGADRYMSREEFVLTYGRYWTWLPGDWPRFAPNFCFHNSGQLALMRKDMTYVEGFVWRGVLPFPIHHAWNVTPEGLVVDSTLRDDPEQDAEGREYYGVPFSTTFVRKSWRGRNTCSLLDHHEKDFPILKREFVYVKRVHEERLSRELKSEGSRRKA
jgi:hypothetical protein